MIMIMIMIIIVLTKNMKKEKLKFFNKNCQSVVTNTTQIHLEPTQPTILAHL